MSSSVQEQVKEPPNESLKERLKNATYREFRSWPREEIKAIPARVWITLQMDDPENEELPKMFSHYQLLHNAQSDAQHLAQTPQKKEFFERALELFENSVDDDALIEDYPALLQELLKNKVYEDDE